MGSNEFGEWLKEMRGPPVRKDFYPGSCLQAVSM